MLRTLRIVRLQRILATCKRMVPQCRTRSPALQVVRLTSGLSRESFSHKYDEYNSANSLRSLMIEDPHSSAADVLQWSEGVPDSWMHADTLWMIAKKVVHGAIYTDTARSAVLGDELIGSAAQRRERAYLNVAATSEGVVYQDGSGSGGGIGTPELRVDSRWGDVCKSIGKSARLQAQDLVSEPVSPVLLAWSLPRLLWILNNLIASPHSEHEEAMAAAAEAASLLAARSARGGSGSVKDVLKVLRALRPHAGKQWAYGAVVRLSHAISAFDASVRSSADVVYFADAAVALAGAVKTHEDALNHGGVLLSVPCRLLHTICRVPFEVLAGSEGYQARGMLALCAQHVARLHALGDGAVVQASLQDCLAAIARCSVLAFSEGENAATSRLLDSAVLALCSGKLGPPRDDTADAMRRFGHVVRAAGSQAFGGDASGTRSMSAPYNESLASAVLHPQLLSIAQAAAASIRTYASDYASVASNSDLEHIFLGCSMPVFEYAANLQMVGCDRLRQAIRLGMVSNPARLATYIKQLSRQLGASASSLGPHGLVESGFTYSAAIEQSKLQLRAASNLHPRWKSSLGDGMEQASLACAAFRASVSRLLEEPALLQRLMSTGSSLSISRQFHHAYPARTLQNLVPWYVAMVHVGAAESMCASLECWNGVLQSSDGGYSHEVEKQLTLAVLDTQPDSEVDSIGYDGTEDPSGVLPPENVQAELWQYLPRAKRALAIDAPPTLGMFMRAGTALYHVLRVREDLIRRVEAADHFDGNDYASELLWSKIARCGKTSYALLASALLCSEERARFLERLYYPGAVEMEYVETAAARAYILMGFCNAMHSLSCVKKGTTFDPTTLGDLGSRSSQWVKQLGGHSSEIGSLVDVATSIMHAVAVSPRATASGLCQPTVVRSVASTLLLGSSESIRSGSSLQAWQGLRLLPEYLRIARGSAETAAGFDVLQAELLSRAMRSSASASTPRARRYAAEATEVLADSVQSDIMQDVLLSSMRAWRSGVWEYPVVAEKCLAIACPALSDYLSSGVLASEQARRLVATYLPAILSRYGSTSTLPPSDGILALIQLLESASPDDTVLATYRVAVAAAADRHDSTNQFRLAWNAFQPVLRDLNYRELSRPERAALQVARDSIPLATELLKRASVQDSSESYTDVYLEASMQLLGLSLEASLRSAAEKNVTVGMLRAIVLDCSTALDACAAAFEVQDDAARRIAWKSAPISQAVSASLACTSRSRSRPEAGPASTDLDSVADQYARHALVERLGYRWNHLFDASSRAISHSGAPIDRRALLYLGSSAIRLHNALPTDQASSVVHAGLEALLRQVRAGLTYDLHSWASTLALVSAKRRVQGATHISGLDVIEMLDNVCPVLGPAVPAALTHGSAGLEGARQLWHATLQLAADSDHAAGNVDTDGVVLLKDSAIRWSVAVALCKTHTKGQFDAAASAHAETAQSMLDKLTADADQEQNWSLQGLLSVARLARGMVDIEQAPDLKRSQARPSRGTQSKRKVGGVSVPRYALTARSRGQGASGVHSSSASSAALGRTLPCERRRNPFRSPVQVSDAAAQNATELNGSSYDDAEGLPVALSKEIQDLLAYVDYSSDSDSAGSTATRSTDPRMFHDAGVATAEKPGIAHSTSDMCGSLAASSQTMAAVSYFGLIYACVPALVAECERPAADGTSALSQQQQLEVLSELTGLLRAGDTAARRAQPWISVRDQLSAGRFGAVSVPADACLALPDAQYLSSERGTDYVYLVDAVNWVLVGRSAVAWAVLRVVSQTLQLESPLFRAPSDAPSRVDEALVDVQATGCFGWSAAWRKSILPRLRNAHSATLKSTSDFDEFNGEIQHGFMRDNFDFEQMISKAEDLVDIELAVLKRGSANHLETTSAALPALLALLELDRSECYADSPAARLLLLLYADELELDAVVDSVIQLAAHGMESAMHIASSLLQSRDALRSMCARWEPEHRSRSSSVDPGFAMIAAAAADCHRYNGVIDYVEAARVSLAAMEVLVQDNQSPRDGSRASEAEEVNERDVVDTTLTNCWLPRSAVELAGQSVGINHRLAEARLWGCKALLHHLRHADSSYSGHESDIVGMHGRVFGLPILIRRAARATRDLVASGDLQVSAAEASCSHALLGLGMCRHAISTPSIPLLTEDIVAVLRACSELATAKSLLSTRMAPSRSDASSYDFAEIAAVADSCSEALLRRGHLLHAKLHGKQKGGRQAHDAIHALNKARLLTEGAMGELRVALQILLRLEGNVKSKDARQRNMGVLLDAIEWQLGRRGPET